MIMMMVVEIFIHCFCTVQVIRAVDPDLAKKKRVAVRNMELVRMMIVMMIVMMMMMIVIMMMIR